MTKTFLHVGPGQSYKDNTTPVFNSDEWEEVRLDIDPDVNPDIVCSIEDMSIVQDSTYDAVYSAHNIEHVYAHQVIPTLLEFKRVLKDDGFLVLTCPDIKSVCKLIGEGNIRKKLYTSAAGDIFPLDILYGHRPSIATGNEYMAHRNGFTSESLLDIFNQSGFESFIIGEDKRAYALWALAYKLKSLTQDELSSEISEHVLKKETING